MALLSTASTYAIRAALYVAVADLDPGAYLSTRRIADDLDVPFPFLTKVLQGLARSGILVSQRGSSGGVALGRPMRDVTLLDIVASVGGDSAFRSCLLGLPACSDSAPCALHEPWRNQRSVLEKTFQKTTLADLAIAGNAAVAKGSRRSAGVADRARSRTRQKGTRPKP